MTPEFRPKPHPREHPEAWTARMITSTFKGSLRVFRSSHTASTVRPVARAAGMMHGCYECGMEFPSKTKLAAHEANRYGRHNAFYWKLGLCTQCPKCLKEFHFKSRLIQHLDQSSLICGDRVREALPDVDPASAAAGRALGSRAGATKCWQARLPAVRAAGPRPRWA